MRHVGHQRGPVLPRDRAARVPGHGLALAGAVAHDDAAAIVAASSDIDPTTPGDDQQEDRLRGRGRGHRDRRQLDLGALVKIVDALAVAHRIDIYGVGASGLVAVDLQ